MLGARASTALVAVALCATACGTTVSSGALSGATQGNGLAPGAVSNAQSADPSSVGGTTTTSAQAADVGGAAGTTATGATTTGGTATDASQTGFATRPLGAKAAITVGFLVAEDVGKALAALGYNGQSSGDGGEQSNAIVAYLNAHGGIGGHPVKPVIFKVSATGGSNQEQSACSTFFDDNKVDAVVGANSEIVSACALQHHVPFVGSALTTVNRAYLAQNPQYAMPTHPVLEDGGLALVDGLVKQGWFRPSSPTEVVKIGLITHENPKYKAVPALVKQRLQAAGLALTDTFFMPYTDQNEGVAASNGKSAALKFQAEGINRVVSVDEHGYGFGWFAIGAGSNSYYPRYGISSLSLPNFYTGLLQPNQLAGAAGVGWAPYIDTTVAHQPIISPRTSACLSAESKAGQHTELGNVRLSIFSICETLFTLADAWRVHQLGIPAFSSGLQALGTGYQPVAVFGTDWTRSRAAANAYRFITYRAACNCFDYSGPVRRFGS